MNIKIDSLNKTILKCKKCPRLVNFIKKISTEKRKQNINETYWGKPVTGFGEIDAKILIIGLAPAAHGAHEQEEHSQVINLEIFYLNVYLKLKFQTNQIQKI